MRTLFALVMLVWGGQALAACPDPSLDGQRHASSGAELIAPKRWSVRAQGTHAAPCAGWTERGIATDDLAGFLPEAPTAVFELEGMGPHILMIMAEAQCRPVLAARTGDGFWFIGETVNGRQELTIWGVPDGPLHVWVGAATVEGCDATVILETFDR